MNMVYGEHTNVFKVELMPPNLKTFFRSKIFRIFLEIEIFQMINKSSISKSSPIVNVKYGRDDLSSLSSEGREKVDDGQTEVRLERNRVA